MEDVSPGILENIQNEFYKKINNSEIIKNIGEKIKNKVATYDEANEYAIEVGNILADAYKNNISSSILPDGKMYFNIANRIIPPTMTKNFELVSDVTNQVQALLNESSGIGIKPIAPELNHDRINGIVNRISSEDNYDSIKWILDEPIKNFSQNIVDDSIRKNVEFQGKTGMQPRIVRKLAGGCCKWCAAIAGTYSYPDVPKDVYRRHQRCRCTINYFPDKSGRAQDVWSKKWSDNVSEDIFDNTNLLSKDPNDILKKFEKIGPEDVTKEYIRRATPGIGNIEYDSNLNESEHKEEIKVANWIYNNFGGDIRVLQENNKEFTPDYIWNDKFWDLKTTSTEKSANSAIRHGMKQITDNPGGIILNYADNDIDIDGMWEQVRLRMQWNKVNSTVDVMVLNKDKLIGIKRYKK